MTTEEFFVNQAGGIHSNEMFPTARGRLSFIHLKEPNPKYKPAKYGFSLIFDNATADQDKPLLDAIKAECTKMAQFYVKTHLAKYARALKRPQLTAKELLEIKVAHWNSKQPVFRDGDTTGYQEYAGTKYIVAKNPSPDFICVGLTRSEFEAGMLCRAVVQPYLGEDGFAYKFTTLKLIKDDGVRFKSAPTGASMLDGLDEAVAAVEVKNAQQTTTGETGYSPSPIASESSLDVL